MVVVIAVLLSVTAISLAPIRRRMLELKMKNILTSVSIPTETSATEAAFNKYITQQIVLNNKGEQVTEVLLHLTLTLKGIR
jgi:Na+-transporting NADH:ubiquinone oxidoreductase subunit C